MFEDNTLIEATHMHILDGQIKNPNNPSICGIGCLGQGKWNSCENYKRTKEYNLWKRIIYSCYDTKDKDYINYGAKGVTLDSRWCNFQVFCEDIQYLEGYNCWRNGKNYELDKDILCDRLKVKPKICSRETCKFIPKSENSIYADITGLTYIGHRISDNYEEEFTVMTEFAKKYNIQQQGISNCIYKRTKQHKGWTFKVKIENS